MSIETSNSKRKILVWGIILCVACICAVAYLIISRQMTIPFIYRLKAGNNYTIVTAYSSNPLEIANDSMQPLAWENFLQHPLCRFMADPFIVREGDDFYIFYEEMPSKLNSTWGDIAVLHSRDLQQWERIGVVLDEPFHLSFPNVFKYNGEWYMLPETGAIQEVRIYKAVDFPLKWSHAHTLLTDDYVLDPAIVQWHDIW